MKKFILTPVFTLLVLMIGGCAGMDSSFSCNKIGGKGANCSTMNDVNDWVNQGDISSTDQGQVHNAIYDRNNEKSKDGKNQAIIRAGISERANEPATNLTPFRVPERTVKLTIFPYIDKTQNFHDTSVVDVLVSPSHWSTPSEMAIRNYKR